jgi:hypothetical protein
MPTTRGRDPWIPSPVLERYSDKAVAPGGRLRKRLVPEFSSVGRLGHFAFRGVGHIDALDTLAVGGIGVADAELSNIALRLTLMPSLDSVVAATTALASRLKSFILRGQPPRTSVRIELSGLTMARVIGGAAWPER